MSVKKIASVGLLTTLALFALGTRDAASEPTVRFPSEQPVPVAARVALLEQRIHQLEQRLAAFERAAQSPPAATAPKAGCEPPYQLDAQGIRRLRPECLHTVARECDPPYMVDVSGIKRFKPECL